MSRVLARKGNLRIELALRKLGYTRTEIDGMGIAEARIIIETYHEMMPDGTRGKTVIARDDED